MAYQKVVINDATLYCGDMTEVIKDLQPVDLIATDNPYPLTAGGKNTGQMKGIFNPKVYNNNGHICRCDIQLEDWLPLCYNILKPERTRILMLIFLPIQKPYLICINSPLKQVLITIIFCLGIKVISYLIVGI